MTERSVMISTYIRNVYRSFGKAEEMHRSPQWVVGYSIDNSHAVLAKTTDVRQVPQLLRQLATHFAAGHFRVEEMSLICHEDARKGRQELRVPVPKDVMRELQALDGAEFVTASEQASGTDVTVTDSRYERGKTVRFIFGELGENVCGAVYNSAHAADAACRERFLPLFAAPRYKPPTLRVPARCGCCGEKKPAAEMIICDSCGKYRCSACISNEVCDECSFEQ